MLDKSTTSQWSGSEEIPECRADVADTDVADADTRWDDKQPDSMTPDEAEILLSSRYGKNTHLTYSLPNNLRCEAKGNSPQPSTCECSSWVNDMLIKLYSVDLLILGLHILDNVHHYLYIFFKHADIIS